jgi:uncharacterized iron-regulated membrane protein
MIIDMMLLGLMVVVIVVGLYGWWSIERQIKKNIDDMDL